MRGSQLLLIEEGPDAAEGQFNSALRDDLGLQCRYVNWNELACLPEALSEVDLVLPVAISRSGRLKRWQDCLRDRGPASPSLAVLAADADSETLRIAAQSADDFLFWPCRLNELRQRIGRLLTTARQFRSACETLRQRLTYLNIVGEDPDFVRMLGSLPKIAAGDCFVLITGETGTGKELIARAIHHLGKRRRFPFIPVDCAALPDALLVNELFGHVPGAFTDARSHQRGLAAMAEGGTLFLDEVDALSPAAQAMLLRFLQERRYKRLGEARISKAEVNVISASNRDVEAMTRRRDFRSDLFFRLSVVQIELPPLRERRGDIQRLAKHHLQSLNASQSPKILSLGARLKLTRHDWPGNVRELFNTLQRACVFCEGRVILPQHILIGEPEEEPSRPPSFKEGRAQAIAAFEKSYVEEMLRRNGGNITQAAREAGKERRAFGRLVKKYGIDRSLF